ncbi:MAG: hypothetical protein ABFD04_13270, partial [Syntrophomonas sp.]
AVLMTTVFVYEWICYRVDGPSYAKAFDDERLTQVYTIFGNLSYVRDIKFTDYFMINTGKMTFTI